MSRSFGRRLVAQVTQRPDASYEFQVADDAEPNAFALPGGFVYVTRGILALANSEDELAGVIGHEIGHVVARHSVRQLEASTPFARSAGRADWRQKTRLLMSARRLSLAMSSSDSARGFSRRSVSRSQEAASSRRSESDQRVPPCRPLEALGPRELRRDIASPLFSQ